MVVLEILRVQQEFIYIIPSCSIEIDVRRYVLEVSLDSLRVREGDIRFRCRIHYLNEMGFKLGWFS